MLEQIEELVRLVNEDIDASSSEAIQQIELTLSELGDAESRLGRLYEAVETGKVSLDDLSPRIKDHLTFMAMFGISSHPLR